jgi:hypothetical protein
VVLTVRVPVLNDPATTRAAPAERRRHGAVIRAVRDPDRRRDKACSLMS